MRKLLVFTLIGFFAQLIDGALGMAYGATSASLLLFLRCSPRRRIRIGSYGRDRHDSRLGRFAYLV
jgi:uncharacterized membrane protein YfcA